ncbi:unnamed protein product [Notodromas monacha]|uniref:UDP-glucuronosyltransferase n=1 Tax=Notodromas monacha TaxID=399045 RepID=A0A7R9BM22_9CRUS|nr:unnamed protein product [Notodromas monacha]CAG0916887.1 unnamed protein product [Notodromas monacha]
MENWLFVCAIFLLRIGEFCDASSRILMLAPVATSSHLTVFRTLGQGLAKRGHHVRILHTLETTTLEQGLFGPGTGKTNTSSGQEWLSDSINGTYVEISPSGIANLFGKYFDNPFQFQREARNGKGTMRMKKMYGILRDSCADVYGDPDFLDTVMRKKFDLVIVQGILNDCVLGAVDKMGVPFMYLSPGPLFPSVQWSLGTPWSVSSAPAPFVQGFGVPKTMLNRLRNLMASAAETFMSNKLGAWATEPVVNSAFGDSARMFDLAAVKRNVSFVLVNQLAAFDYTRPQASNSALVGGMHCRPAGNIEEKELLTFLDNAENGVAYFSLGSTALSTDMPRELRQVFIKTFAKLQMKVVWKLETSRMTPEEIATIPPNVFVSPWLPQQDLLGHKNVKVFLTHGGILSVQEATYHGVPMIGIPIGSDQDMNLQRATSDGRAIVLDFDTLTPKEIISAIRRVISEKSFRENAVAGLHLMRDQPIHPLNRAIFWTEYVIRHNGAKHLRNEGASLPWIPYLNLDLYAMMLIMILVISWCFSRVVRWGFKKLKVAMAPKHSIS